MSFLKHLLPAWKTGIENKTKANAALLHAIQDSLKEAETEALKTKVVLALETATEEWLDKYGDLFGVYRQDDEEDAHYRSRIISYILLERGTIPAIIKAIRNFLDDYDSHISIYEPYTNIFHLNKSKLNGPDHLMGEYYTFATIEIRMSRTIPVGIIDLIDEFRPAGVTVRLSYRPSENDKNRSVVELPLSSSEVKETGRRLSIMNGLNDRLRGHLNLTARSRDEDDNSGLFITNSSKLNSSDRLTGSFAVTNPSYNLASYSRLDQKFTNTSTVADVAKVTDPLSSDFYTMTGAVDSQYATQTIDGKQINYMYFTLDVATFFNENYSRYLREVQPNGQYTKSTYTSLMGNPSVHYSMKTTTAVTSPTTYNVQALNLSTGTWENLETSTVYFSQKTKKLPLTSLANRMSDNGIVFLRIKLAVNSKSDVYDLHLHFLELSFSKEIAQRESSQPYMNSGSSATSTYAVGFATFDGGVGTVNIEEELDAGTFSDGAPTDYYDGGYF